MKIERQKPQFTPVTITLESEDDVSSFKHILARSGSFAPWIGARNAELFYNKLIKYFNETFE